MKYPELTRRWFDESNYLILVSVPNEEVLLDHAATIGVPNAVIREPDLNNEATAVAVGPSETAWRALAQLPLAFREVAMS